MSPVRVLRSHEAETIVQTYIIIIRDKFQVHSSRQASSCFTVLRSTHIGPQSRDDAQQHIVDAEWKGVERCIARVRILHAAIGKAILLQMQTRDRQRKLAVDRPP